MARPFYTLTADDVGKANINLSPCPCCGRKRSLPLASALGRVLPGDVGKRVYYGRPMFAEDVQVENDEQRDARRQRDRRLRYN